jgi:uncharacterized protein (DUF1499 family)
MLPPKASTWDFTRNRPSPLLSGCSYSSNEAGLFAGELRDMYLRYAQRQRWAATTLSRPPVASTATIRRAWNQCQALYDRPTFQFPPQGLEISDSFFAKENPDVEVAAQQRAAYPAIQPVNVALPPDRSFEQALSTVVDQGWEIVAAVPSEGRIEATDTTLWWGFKDDVVIRIRPVEGGARVDVRSKSRIGTILRGVREG